jgi:pilus assembly protein CpaE
MTVFWEADLSAAEQLRSAIAPGGPLVASLDDLDDYLSLTLDEDTIVVGPTVPLGEALKLAESMRVNRTSLGVVLVRHQVDAALLNHALRAGVREVVPTHDAGAIRSAVRHSSDLATALRDAGGGSGSAVPSSTPRGHVLTVFSAKGGCGKTTLATNLAAALADRGRHEVCLVDLDLAFGDVAIALQLFPARTIADAVPLARSLDYTAVQALLTPHSPGLSTLVAPLEPGTADTIPATLVAKVLELLRAQFEYVVIDTPPAFDDQVLAAFDVSDVIALIATLDVPALKNLKVTLETMELLNYPRDKWRVVLNRADSKVGLSMNEVEKSLRTSIALQIPSSRDVPAAINRGVPIVLDDPKHSVSTAIRHFAERQVAGFAAAAAADGSIPNALRSDRRGFRRRRKGRDQ